MIINTEELNWDPLNHSADKVWIAQVWSPGLCDIDAADSLRKFEYREVRGADGAELTYVGLEPARFRIRFRLYTSEHWAEWIAFKKVIFEPPTAKTPNAFDIWHPILVEQRIHRVVIENFVQPTQVEDGVWVAEIRCIEWRPLRYALARVKGSKATPKKQATPKQPSAAPTPPPLSPNQEKIKANDDTINELAKPPKVKRHEIDVDRP